MKILYFLVALAAILMLLGIGVEHGFNLDVYIDLLKIGWEFIRETVQEIIHKYS
ncbi:hypothetical protein MYX76_16960 [Desulfobacterota bacterium AH_259_B03_O07]|nr:hypothetical protein [Desulfobacterota bacterium AH_259_B03_O07]